MMNHFIMSIAGYDIIEEIQSGINSAIYRATIAGTNKGAIVKLLKAEYPTLEEITRLKHEYQILQHLGNLEGIVKPYSLETYKNGLALILEDFGGESLKKYLNNCKTIEISDFLKIAIQIASALAEVHKKHVIHKDIKPQNILINPKTGEVKLADFSIATRLDRENAAASHPNFLEGTLAYMSPEQTGRMNRSIDYRTDLYSLGVTFYEMLTGSLPCTNSEPLELVYCHIAKKIIPPCRVETLHETSLQPEIPPAISDLVMKLLAKTAEERYQSALGLKADLEICSEMLRSSGNISTFIPGEVDKFGQFLIPQKLYGREAEVASLLATFDRVAQGKNEMILVAGYSGIGKSALVHEIHKPIVRQKGYFISGKYDQFKRNIPYASLIQAFQELMRQLLTESRENLAIWKEKILEACGENGQIIIDVIPEVKLIIGEQPSVPPLGPSEAQNRFNRIFQRFINVFCQPDRPLVLFLDDLQWADLASLKLIQLMMSERDRQYLLIIGAYRDNEVSPTHPLMLTLDEIKKKGAIVNTLIVQPLDIHCVEQLLAETLNLHQKSNFLPVETRNFASLLFNKTGGNPFFLTQLLSTLHQEELLKFDFSKGCWVWDIEQIQAIAIADLTVVELVARNIQKLPPATQDILKLAACIGNQFNLEVLAIVNEKSPSITAEELWNALQAGLILPLSNAYKIPMLMDGNQLPQFSITQISYKFLHDRVQQAAYSLIPQDRKKTTHLKIGQLLLQQTGKIFLEENIFDIVNQLNIGVEFIIEQSQKDELASLNLMAGKKAIASNAYEAALKYLNVGLELLAADSWQTQYKLTLALYDSTVAAEYLNTHYERANQISDIVLSQAKTLLDKIPVYEKKIQYYIAQNQMQAAIDTALPVLKLLGIVLPKLPNKRDILLGLIHVKLSLAGKQIEKLADLPEMTDKYKLAALQILITVLPATFQANPLLVPLVTFSMIHLSVKYGNSQLAAYAYAYYAIIICSVIGDIDSGYRFGKLGVSLLDQFKARELKPKVSLLFNAGIRHWKEHARETLEPFLEAIQISLEIGDIEYACYHAMDYCTYPFLMGEPLESVAYKQTKYLDLMAKSKQEFQLIYTKIWNQLIFNLQGLAADKYRLIGQNFNEDEILPQLLQTKNSLSIFCIHFFKSLLAYLFKDYDRAVESATLAEGYAEGVVGMMTIAAHNFYYSLILLACATKASKSQQKKYFSQVVSNQKKLKKWAFHAPMNYQHKYDLVEAEKARVLGQYEKAAELYDRAIAGAKKQGYIQEEAIANELAAEFYFSRDRATLAEVYLTQSYYGYIRWGAKAKVQDLEERYPQFFSEKLKREASSMEVYQTTSSTTSTGLSRLDITTVMKASQALAGEIILDKLLSKLMLIVRENAGAQKGYLILEKDGELFVEATISEENNEVLVLQSNPVYVGASLANNLETQQINPTQNPPSYNLPLSLINYVTRTRENLVLNDANAEPRFSTDPYIATSHPKSILCTPLIHQGKLVGLLYLENNLTKGAFTSDRLEILRLLSSQAAISIENARLYTNLETAKDQLQNYSKTLEVQVEERTLELKEKNDNLQQEMRDRLLAEDALRLSEERFRAIFESTDDFIAVWDRNYHCLYGNQAWLNSMKIQRDRVIGKNFSEIFKDDSPETIMLWMSRFETVFNTCKSLHFEDATTVGDIPSYSESTVSPIKDSTGNVFAVGVVYRDITERKLAEAALRDSEARLRQQAIELQEALDELRRTQIQLIQNEKMASLGQLVGGVAHEINNPASFIYGNLTHAKEYIQNLLQILHLYQKHYPEPDPEIQEQAEENELDFIVEDLPNLLESMQMGVKRIRNIVLSLRNFSRLDESDMKRVDIHEGIESALLILQNRLNNKDGTPAIEVIKEYNTLPEIECYVGHLNQVFMNILTNAIDALEMGTGDWGLGIGNSPIPTIRIRTELIDNKIAVRIADNGSGIPEEIQPNIFDPFFTTKPVGKGTGLGLSISYKIVVEKHGGNLQCISSSGNGAEFIVEIPLRQLIKT